MSVVIHAETTSGEASTYFILCATLVVALQIVNENSTCDQMSPSNRYCTCVAQNIDPGHGVESRSLLALESGVKVSPGGEHSQRQGHFDITICMYVCG